MGLLYLNITFPLHVEGGNKEITMTRMHVDCREHPGKIPCTVALSADSEEELLEATVQHLVAIHRYADTPELRDQVRKDFKAGETTFHDWPKPGETPAYLRQELDEDEE
jgi:predicted small metal-binding protein